MRKPPCQAVSNPIPKTHATGVQKRKQRSERTKDIFKKGRIFEARSGEDAGCSQARRDVKA